MIEATIQYNTQHNPQRPSQNLELKPRIETAGWLKEFNVNVTQLTHASAP